MVKEKETQVTNVGSKDSQADRQQSSTDTLRDLQDEIDRVQGTKPVFIDKEDKTPEEKEIVAQYAEELQEATRAHFLHSRQLLSESHRLYLEKFKEEIYSRIPESQKLDIIAERADKLPTYCRLHGETYPVPYVGRFPVPISDIRTSDFVAACNKNGDWILGEVVTAGNTFSVRDVLSKKQIQVSKEKIIPLPKWQADPVTDGEALFKVGSVVLALFVGTSCFYKAVVLEIPSAGDQFYVVAFEGTDGEWERKKYRVGPWFVIKLPGDDDTDGSTD